MESKMEMSKVFEKTMLEKGTLICVRRKWLWFRETIIQEELTNRMFILFVIFCYTEFRHKMILYKWVLQF